MKSLGLSRRFDIRIFDSRGKAVFKQTTSEPALSFRCGEDIREVLLCKTQSFTVFSGTKDIKPNKPKIGTIYQVNEEFLSNVKSAASCFSFWDGKYGNQINFVDDRPLFYVISNKGDYTRFEFSGSATDRHSCVERFFYGLSRVFESELSEEVRTYSTQIENKSLGFCEVPVVFGLGFHFLAWLEENKVFTPA